MYYELSHWEYDTYFKSLDFVVLGSGIVGLSAACHLKTLRPKWNIAVIDRGSLPLGASTRNAGFACFGSMTELLDDLSHHTDTEVWGLVERRWKGLLKLRERLGDFTIGYEPFGGFEVFRSAEKQAFEACLDHLSHFNKSMKAITGHSDVFKIFEKPEANFQFKDVPFTIQNTLEGQIHTGAMMHAWIQRAKSLGISLFYGLSIQSVQPTHQGVELETEAGWSFTVPGIIVALNGFAGKLLPELSVTPARNQVMITEPIPNLRLRGAFHYDRGYFYFRNVGSDRILLGGGRNLDLQKEATTEFGTTAPIKEALMKLLQDMIVPYHLIKPERWWSGIMGVGNEKKPIVRQLHERLTVAVRLGGMGVAIGTLVGEEAAELAIFAEKK